MIKGTGIDLTKVQRYEKFLKDDRFLEKYFHEEEILHVKSRGAGAAQSLAGKFAAREAFFKALGTGFRGFSPKDITVINNNDGKPEIQPSSKVREVLDDLGQNWCIHLSISHEKEYAIAQVILEV